MKDSQSRGNESKKFGIIGVDEVQMTTVKVIKCQLFMRVISEGVTIVSSVILLRWLFDPSQLICC